MDRVYLDLATDDFEAFINDRLPNESHENENLKILFRFSHGPVSTQLKRLHTVLQALGSRTKYVGLLMIGAMNDDKIHMEIIKSIDKCCPNLKEFYAAGLSVRNEQFSDQTLKSFLARLEKITMQMGGFEGVNTFADCKKLQEWTQEIFYGFNGKCLNFNFPELRSINFSKVDEIDNKHLEPFLSKNPQIKSLALTRCTIDPKILELISKHAPIVEEISFNFRRSLVKRSDMQKNIKCLLGMQHLKALNLDCIGVAVGDTLMKMAEKDNSIDRVGLFCCPWENKLIKVFADFKGLKSLHLSNVTGLHDDCLRHLSKSLIGINDLTLKFIKNITMDGVIKLMAECQRLTTATLVLKRMTTISTDRYNLLLEAIKKRPLKTKLTITLWGSKSPLKLSKDLLKRNLEFLEILQEEDELNKNTDFDFYCETNDGGYDLMAFAPSPGCSIN